jgi:hypothetical protein
MIWCLPFGIATKPIERCHCTMDRSLLCVFGRIRSRPSSDYNAACRCACVELNENTGFWCFHFRSALRVPGSTFAHRTRWASRTPGLLSPAILWCRLTCKKPWWRYHLGILTYWELNNQVQYFYNLSYTNTCMSGCMPSFARRKRTLVFPDDHFTCFIL